MTMQCCGGHVLGHPEPLDNGAGQARTPNLSVLKQQNVLLTSAVWLSRGIWRSASLQDSGPTWAEWREGESRGLTLLPARLLSRRPQSFLCHLGGQSKPHTHDNG